MIQIKMTPLEEVKDGKFYWLRKKGMSSWTPGIREHPYGKTHVWKLTDDYIFDEDEEFIRSWEIGPRIYEPDEMNLAHEIETKSELTGNMLYPSIEDAITQMQTDKSIKTLTIAVSTTLKETLTLVRHSNGELVLEMVGTRQVKL